MKLFEIVTLKEADMPAGDSKLVSFKKLIDALEYNMENNEDTFSMKSAKTVGNTCKYDLEDEQGHKALYYWAEVEIKGDKVHVSCEEAEGTFDLVAAPEDEDDDNPELDDLVHEIMDVLNDGVSGASDKDNDESDDDHDEDD
jgi:hypothetical protein